MRIDIMRPHGTSAELERRRRLAVRRVRSGYTQQGVADFLGVHSRASNDGCRPIGKDGMAGLKAKPHSGPTADALDRTGASGAAMVSQARRASSVFPPNCGPHRG